MKRFLYKVYLFFQIALCENILAVLYGRKPFTVDISLTDFFIGLQMYTVQHLNASKEHSFINDF